MGKKNDLLSNVLNRTGYRSVQERADKEIAQILSAALGELDRSAQYIEILRALDAGDYSVDDLARTAGWSLEEADLRIQACRELVAGESK